MADASSCLPAGVVTEVVNPSAAPFFGFAPSSLEGQNLEDFISVFEAWHGANPSTPMKQLMDVLADKADTSEAGYETWRVAIKQPGVDLSSMTAAAAAKALKPAIMQVRCSERLAAGTTQPQHPAMSFSVATTGGHALHDRMMYAQLSSKLAPSSCCSVQVYQGSAGGFPVC
jgi:hypothetical protein